jgi:two-component system chemotaxis family response regulator WspR
MENKEQINVLLIDNQQMIFAWLQHITQNKPDISAHHCRDPWRAIKMTIDSNIDVILMDTAIPDNDAISLTRNLRASPHTQDVQIIVLTSQPSAEYARDAFIAGADDYLVIMPDSIDMVARIRNRANRHKLLRDLRREIEELRRKDHD